MSALHPAAVSLRVTYLVCYDIANDKRLRKVFKVCKNHGTHLQFSRLRGATSLPANEPSSSVN